MIFKDLKIMWQFGYGYIDARPFNIPDEYLKEIKGYYTNYGKLYFLFNEYLTEEELIIKIKIYYRKQIIQKIE